jgi:feruloyl esterase
MSLVSIRLAVAGVLLLGVCAIRAQGPEVEPAILADLSAVAARVPCAQLQSFDLSKALGAKVQIQAASEVSENTPAPYCKVEGTIAPAIRFEVHLPLKSWTQRYLQTGCGGLCGNLNVNVGRAEDCAPATNGELVVASTDMGHSNGPGRGAGNDGAWAAANPQTKVDFAYRAEHLTAVASKALINQFYGQMPKYSYFSGCSDGGREALMEAQRYPEDFDGIAAGAPAMNFVVQNTFYHAWNALTNTGADGKAILTADKLPALHKAVLAACDELDGVKDDLISDPFSCKFDPAVTICKEGENSTNCLTAAQATVAKEIYAGAHDASGRKFVISGPLYGSEVNWAGVYVPQDAGQTIFSASIASGVIHYLAYDKPLGNNFQLKDFKFDQATFDGVRPQHALYDSTDPDLSKFAARGGRLFLYHGLADPHISPLNTIAYYTSMRDKVGATKADQFSRLYLFPGAGHCNGGEGPFEFPLLSIMMGWVESGTAPNAVIASHRKEPAGGRGGRGGRGPAQPIDRTRPIYPYPTVAAYKGAGDPNDAAYFQPKTSKPVDPKQLTWQGSANYTAGYERWCEWSGTAMNCSSTRK